MTNLTQYFTSGPQGTIALKAGTNFSYKGDHLQVYEDTEIDRWFVGSFSSATYFITVEFDSNQKETLQVLVVARPDHASFTVYGRTSVDNQLITISAEVNSSWLSLRATPADPLYAGSRISVLATYAETMLPLTRPTAVGTVAPGGGGSGGGTAPPPLPGGGTGSGVSIEVSDIAPAATETGSLWFNSNTGELFVYYKDGTSDQWVQPAYGGDQFGNSVAINFPNTNLVPNVTTYSNGSNTWLWNGTTWKNRSSGGTLNLNDLTDVDVAAATNGQLLSYNAPQSTWQARTVTTTTSTTLPLLTVTGISTLNSIAASGAITAASTLNVVGATTVNNLFVNGNLEITGTTTVINSSSLEIADTSIVIAKNANTPLQANGAGILIQGAGAELKWNNSAGALTVNKHLLPEFGNNLSLGSVDKVWANVYALTLNGSIVSPSQTNITSVGALDSLNVIGNIVSSANLSAVNITSSGIINVTTSSETIIDVASTSSVSYNFNQSAIFYHATSPTIDWNAAFIGLPTTANRVLSINIVVPQGSTPYKITACTIDGVIQPILWPGGTALSGTASKTDIWAFTFIRRNNTWIALASLSSNFG